MKFRFLVKLAGLLSCVICLVAQAQEPSTAEVIEIVDKVTGCGKDALTSLYGESPALFDKVADTVTATRVVNKILEARDEDAAMEVFEARKPPRQYLGASGIGHACERKSWLDFRHASPRKIDAKGLRRIQDGFAGEQIMIERLRMVKGVKLHTHEGDDQIGIEAHGGHFRGHLDGLILGLIQAPTK